MADPGLTARIDIQPSQSARAALVALGWTPPQGGERETDLWHLLVHVPHGLEAEICGLLERVGCKPYRMWKAGEERPGG